MRAAIGFGLVAVAVAMTAPAWGQDEGKEQDKRLGTYEYVSGKSGEGEIPKDQLKGTVKVTKDMILLLDEEGKESFAISYKISGEEEPFKIDMKIERSVFEDAVGSTAKGLGKHDGQQATLIYEYGENPDYPDDFEPEGQQHLFVLKQNDDKSQQ